jgi:hypothetical protein
MKMSITIPVPFPLGRQRGLTGFQHDGLVKSIRLHRDDLALITEEANALCMTSGELIRWLVIYAAQSMHKKRTNILVEVNP